VTSGGGARSKFDYEGWKASGGLSPRTDFLFRMTWDKGWVKNGVDYIND